MLPSKMAKKDKIQMGQHLKDKLYDEMTAKLRDESFMAHKGL